MAASLMSAGQIDAVLVGADRITGCGDTANKIGTLSVAVLCHHFHIPFYVCAPSTTIDHYAPARERHSHRTKAAGRSHRQLVCPAFNHTWHRCLHPAFDVTPAELISAIITEDGVFRPPFNF
jgi:methylthioribose-1-phosphate isomerase